MKLKHYKFMGYSNKTCIDDFQNKKSVKRYYFF